jgi:hypothetical protein
MIAIMRESKSKVLLSRHFRLSFIRLLQNTQDFDCQQHKHLRNIARLTASLYRRNHVANSLGQQLSPSHGDPQKAPVAPVGTGSFRQQVVPVRQKGVVVATLGHLHDIDLPHDDRLLAEVLLIEVDEVVEPWWVDLVVLGCREEAGSGSQVALIFTIEDVGMALATVVLPCIFALGALEAPIL